MEIPDIKTDQRLLNQLRARAGMRMSKEESHAQRVSYIVSSVSPEISRQQIETQLNKQEGGT